MTRQNDHDIDENGAPKRQKFNKNAKIRKWRHGDVTNCNQKFLVIIESFHGF